MQDLVLEVNEFWVYQKPFNVLCSVFFAYTTSVVTKHNENTFSQTHYSEIVVCPFKPRFKIAASISDWKSRQKSEIF